MALLKLGLTDYLHAESHGRPGQRTFNITARSPRGSAIVWIEKEQLFQVGATIKQFIASREPVSDPLPFELGSDSSSEFVDTEFKTPQMTLRHEPASDVFTLLAENFGEDDSDEPEHIVEFSFTRDQAVQLAERALEVVASGRPPCPLCTGPINSGEDHFCVKVNGHTEIGPFRIRR
ncbi:MAG: DUF3090 family protein [Chloroflexi bacterium]|nr:DUF3090 family protein [Chloroflexota bacterium]